MFAPRMAPHDGDMMRSRSIVLVASCLLLVACSGDKTPPDTDDLSAVPPDLLGPKDARARPPDLAPRIPPSAER